MEDIEKIILRTKAVAEKMVQEMKESDCNSLQPSKVQTSAVTSDCPLGLCDGSGIIWNNELQGGVICNCQKLAVQKKKLGFAQIPEEFSNYKVSSFETDIYVGVDSKHYARIAKLAAINFIKKFETIRPTGKGLYFYSNEKGSGKTRLMASIGNALVKQYMENVRFVTTNNLLDEIKKSFTPKRRDDYSEAQEDYATIIKEIKEVEVLLLDDFGAERSTEWVNEIFYSIINDRMSSKKITLFTSNLSMEELTYDYRTVNRVMKMAMPVKFPEESIRLQQAMSENEEFMKLLLGDTKGE